MAPRALILASASPRRKELLARVGVAVDVRPAHVDESILHDEPALEYVRRVAAAKADAIASSMGDEGASERAGRWVLGADTIVAIQGRILGKAASPEEASAMLLDLVGRTHLVTTAFALRKVMVDGGPVAAPVDRMVTTEVTMRHASEHEIADYVAAGEWRGKAGAYAVQGMAAALVESVRGSITNVIGLPLSEVLTELCRVGAGRADYARGISA